MTKANRPAVYIRYERQHSYIEQTVIFVHLFRTAGTTLYRVIDRNFYRDSYFIRRTPHHYCYHLIHDNQLSLADFIHCRQDIMLDNVQTRFLSGLETGHEVGFGKCARDVLEAAKRNLGHFAVVGLIVNQRLSPFIRLYWEARKVSVRTMVRKWIQLWHSSPA
jgi:hypothetical protein